MTNKTEFDKNEQMCREGRRSEAEINVDVGDILTGATACNRTVRGVANRRSMPLLPGLLQAQTLHAAFARYVCYAVIDNRADGVSQISVG